MIRQAICCDICNAEKKQTNHWFVAYDQNGELRISGWNSRNRLRPRSKPLCGQTCLHKLVDKFMARILAVRLQPNAADDVEMEAGVAATDGSLTGNATYSDAECSAQVIPPPVRITPKVPPFNVQPELVTMPARIPGAEPTLAPDEPPRFASRNWRAEAWDRERSMRGVDRGPGIIARRRVGS